jgi:hypothetical protein
MKATGRFIRAPLQGSKGASLTMAMKPILAFACAAFATSVSQTPLRASPFVEPLYSYAIVSEGFYRDADLFTKDQHFRIPGTPWFCDLEHTYAKFGLVARCKAPKFDEHMGAPEVLIHVTCTGKEDSEAQILHLSMFEHGFASITLMCGRQPPDLGF